MTRITKKLRAEAALLCSAAAFRGEIGGDEFEIGSRKLPAASVSNTHWLVREIDVSPDAADLADSAFEYVIDSTWRIPPIIWLDDTLSLIWSTAEALLMTGWEPGEGWR